MSRGRPGPGGRRPHAGEAAPQGRCSPRCDRSEPPSARLPSHIILARPSIRISHLIRKYTGDHEQFSLLCLVKQTSFSPERVVVHAFASPAAADPGWDDDLAWLDRDPVTAAEREASLDRLCEQDDGPPRRRGGRVRRRRLACPATSSPRSKRRPRMTCSLLDGGRLGPAGPGPARLGPGLPRRSSSRAAAFGPGMVVRRAAWLRAAGGRRRRRPRGDDVFDGVSEAELVGVVCAWDRVEAHAAARKLAAIGELARPEPSSPKTPSSPPIRWPARWGSPGSAPMS